MHINPDIFRSYDVRGIYPTDLNESIVYRIIQTHISLFLPKSMVIGRDVRTSGKSLQKSAMDACTDAGVDVIDIGVVSTDTFYFAVGKFPVDGGVTISASHNGREWNGLNFCKKGAEPMSSQTGLFKIRDELLKGFKPLSNPKKGNVTTENVTDDFLKRVISFVNPTVFKGCKIVANGNFGVDVLLLKRAVELFNLPINIISLNGEPDRTFPKGPPNPLLPENRLEFLELVKKEKADLGVSWDADGDRCFFADETGTFIEGYFMTAILATEILKKERGSTIVIDPRLTWATTEAITDNGGKVVISKPGMTIIPEKMKETGAVFAGEMSSHFYFKENFYRDNGLIPLFLVLELLSNKNTTLSQLAKHYTSKYFISGELNFETKNKDEIIKGLEEKYKDGNIEHIDGLSVEYSNWRFNIRKSNTEPLLRFNLEALSKERMEEKRDEVVQYINQHK